MSQCMQVQASALHKTWRAFKFTFAFLYFLNRLRILCLVFFWAYLFQCLFLLAYSSGLGIGNARMFAVSSYAWSLNCFKCTDDGFSRR